MFTANPFPASSIKRFSIKWTPLYKQVLSTGICSDMYMYLKPHICCAIAEIYIYVHMCMCTYVSVVNEYTVIVH